MSRKPQYVPKRKKQSGQQDQLKFIPLKLLKQVLNFLLPPTQPNQMITITADEIQI